MFSGEAPAGDQHGEGDAELQRDRLRRGDPHLGHHPDRGGCRYLAESGQSKVGGRKAITHEYDVLCSYHTVTLPPHSSQQKLIVCGYLMCPLPAGLLRRPGVPRLDQRHLLRPPRRPRLLLPLLHRRLRPRRARPRRDGGRHEDPHRRLPRHLHRQDPGQRRGGRRSRDRNRTAPGKYDNSICIFWFIDLRRSFSFQLLGMAFAFYLANTIKKEYETV